MARDTDKRWKGRLIDWPTIAAMDDEEYQLKPLNQQHVAILLALLEYQKWTTRWVNLGISTDELQAYIGDIELRLMMNEGGLDMTPEELKGAIRDGIYEATNNVAKQIVSGRVTNIAVGDDGTVSDPSDGEAPDVDLPEDDPTTSYDETSAASYGGSISLLKGVRLFLDKIDNYYGPVNGTPVTSSDDTKFFIKAFFPTDEAEMDAAIDDYYTYRGTNGRFVFQDTAAVTLYIFCHGNNEAAWGRWLVDQSGYPQTKMAMMKTLTDALASAFWTEYYTKGIDTPSLNYLDAPCVPSPSETLLVPNLVATGISANNWKINHRLKITTSGFWTDVNGDIKDSWWYRAASGALTFQAANYTIQVGGINVVKPTTDVVPYKTNHQYVYTIDTPAAGDFRITIPATSMEAPITGSGLTLLIEDLGEISV